MVVNLKRPTEGAALEDDLVFPLERLAGRLLCRRIITPRQRSDQCDDTNDTIHTYLLRLVIDRQYVGFGCAGLGLDGDRTDGTNDLAGVGTFECERYGARHAGCRDGVPGRDRSIDDAIDHRVRVKGDLPRMQLIVARVRVAGGLGVGDSIAGGEGEARAERAPQL